MSLSTPARLRSCTRTLPPLQSRDHAFQSKAAADGAALLREQARLERELGGAGGTAAQLVGLSLAGTLRALIRYRPGVGFRRSWLGLKASNADMPYRPALAWARPAACSTPASAHPRFPSPPLLRRLGAHKQAAALRKQFGMPDARFWWVRLRTLAEARDWEALDALASEKKSPVGWEPFLEVARAWGAPRDVQAR